MLAAHWERKCSGVGEELQAPVDVRRKEDDIIFKSDVTKDEKGTLLELCVLKEKRRPGEFLVPLQTWSYEVSGK